MPPRPLCCQNAISETIVRVWNTRSVTRSERQTLMDALLDYRIGSEEKAAIDRLLHAIRRGWLQLMD